MKMWTFPVRCEMGAGPWDSEPDKAQWIDEATDLDCLVVRNSMGALCGYVGVPPGHPWHGRTYYPGPIDVEVHGGLTFSNFCQEGAGEGHGVCHVPEPGRPDNVWWLGFDCAHAGDVVPTLRLFPGDQYRTFSFVQGECARLAAQIHKAGIVILTSEGVRS
jgi:hypothetical protein